MPQLSTATPAARLPRIPHTNAAAAARSLTNAWPTAALLFAMVVATVVLLHEGRHQTFFNDDWDLILHRRGVSAATFLTPEHGHLVAIPIFIYKALLAVFGASSYVPFQATLIAFALLSSALVFVYVRKRVGDVAALAAAVLVLFRCWTEQTVVAISPRACSSAWRSLRSASAWRSRSP